MAKRQLLEAFIAYVDSGDSYNSDSGDSCNSDSGDSCNSEDTKLWISAFPAGSPLAALAALASRDLVQLIVNYNQRLTWTSLSSVGIHASEVPGRD